MDELFTLIQTEIKVLLEKHLTPHFNQMEQDRANMTMIENILRQMPEFKKLEQENRTLRERLPVEPVPTVPVPVPAPAPVPVPTAADCIKLEIVENPKNEAPNEKELYQVANLLQNVENKPTSLIDDEVASEASEVEESEVEESEVEESEAEASEVEESEVEESEVEESEVEESEVEEEEEDGVEGAEPIEEEASEVEEEEEDGVEGAEPIEEEASEAEEEEDGVEGAEPLEEEASEAEEEEEEEEEAEAEASEAEASEAEASEEEGEEEEEEGEEEGEEEEEAEDGVEGAEPLGVEGAEPLGVEGAEPLEEPLEEEVDIIEIKGHGKFYAANTVNSDIYAVDSDGEPGDQVGKFVNKVATFF